MKQTQGCVWHDSCGQIRARTPQAPLRPPDVNDPSYPMYPICSLGMSPHLRSILGLARAMPFDRCQQRFASQASHELADWMHNTTLQNQPTGGVAKHHSACFLLAPRRLAHPVAHRSHDLHAAYSVVMDAHRFALGYDAGNPDDLRL